MRETRPALESVIRHAEDLEGDVGSVVADLADSGDTTLIPRIQEALADFLAGRDFYGRDLMCEILAGILGVEAFPTLLGAWAVDVGDDRDSLSAMVWNLIPIDRTACLATMRQFAQSRDLARRRAGVWAMGHATGPDGIDDADFDLLATAARDPDADLRATALGALSSLKSDDRAFAVMRSALHDFNPDVRVSALAGLGYSGRADAMPAIVDLTTDHDSRVRVFVAQALGTLRDQAGVPAALGLLDDRDPRVQLAAMSALGAIGGTQAATALIELCESPDPEVRIGVAQALGANVTKGTIGHVHKLATDPESAVRAQTVAALGWSARDEGGPIVAERADDPDATVRLRVAVAIDRVNWPAADVILRQLAQDPDSSVRRTATRTMELRSNRTATASGQ